MAPSLPERFFHDLPKVGLHCCLLGTVQRATLTCARCPGSVGRLSMMMTMTPCPVALWLCRAGLAAGMLLAGPLALAAGGHHAVDDAALLDHGRCQVEAWFDRQRHSARSLLHLGPGCRVGAVELELSIDRVRAEGAGTSTTLGPQLKWAREIGGGLGIGAVIAVAVQAEHRPDESRLAGGTALVPLTWQAADTLALHVNLGRDFVRGAADFTRIGVALEWAPVKGWSFVGERFRESGANHWRLAARWALAPSVAVDLGRAQGAHGSVPPWWTAGLSWTFDR